MRVVATFVALGMLVAACDKPREILHDMTKPTASTAAAPPPSVVVNVNVTVAAPDAGPASTSKAKTAAGPAPLPAPAPKRKQPPLNGLPAGAVCVQGSEGNGGCASGSECTAGKCTCFNGWTSCGGACRDLSRDPDNCDKCGHECEIGRRCKFGNCE